MFNSEELEFIKKILNEYEQIVGYKNEEEDLKDLIIEKIEVMPESITLLKHEIIIEQKQNQIDVLKNQLLKNNKMVAELEKNITKLGDKII